MENNSRSNSMVLIFFHARFPLERLPHFTPDTMEFQVHRNHVSLLCSVF
jgi:hypothetical protein